MKTVLLLRHAKSDWGNPMMGDFDRPLSKRGIKDAPRIGRTLKKFTSTPDTILSSPATRAKRTAEIVAKVAGYEGSIQEEPDFYGGDESDLITALQQLSNDIECPLLVGHNPTMEDTAAMLLSGDIDEASSLAIQIPTAGLICLDIPITTWAELKPGEAILRWFLIPRLIKSIT